MLEEATWRKGNRRAFDVLQRLCEQAGLEIQTPPLPDEAAEPAEEALAVVYYVGYRLLAVLKGAFAAFGGKLDKKALKRLNNEMTGEGGARASVMLTLAVAETIEDEDGSVVRATYSVPAEDERFLTEAFERSPSLSHAAAVISTHAIEIACGFSNARNTPVFEGLGEIDWRELPTNEEPGPGRSNWGELVAKVAHPWEGAQERWGGEAATAEKSLDERDEELIEEITTLAYGMDREETPPEHTVDMIGAVVPLIAADAEPDRQETMSVLARLGYFSRMAEGITVEGSAWQSEEITAAIQTCLENPGDAETIGDAMAECAARFATREPLAGSTEDMRDEGSLLAEVAGLAHIERLTIGGRMSGASVANEMYELPEDPGEMRSVMASEEYQAFAESEEVSDAATEVFRGWIYGYFLRLIDEYILESGIAEPE